jgi:hypothetical protein
MNGLNGGLASRNPQAQIQQIAAELWLALGQTDSSEMARLASHLPSDFVGALGRRARNLAILASEISGWTCDEIRGIAGAATKGTLVDHLKNRGGTAAESASRAYEQVCSCSRSVIESPREQLPRMFVIMSTALLASGGPDGDGGIPDLDIPLLGIGAHRSPLTHSFLTGAALEALAIALIRTIAVVHKNLPDKRHSAWDRMTPKLIRGIEHARGGATLGLAYHFLVDGVLQPGPYHGLPIEMPLEVHQAIFVGSGLGELGSHMEEVSAAQAELVKHQWRLAWLVTRIVQDDRLSHAVRFWFLDFAFGTSSPCARGPTKPEASGPQHHPREDAIVGKLMRCSQCNRCRAISRDFFVRESKHLGRPMGVPDLRLLTCRECGAKRSFEVVA